jgi:CRP-like cAMP-binding protein
MDQEDDTMLPTQMPRTLPALPRELETLGWSVELTAPLSEAELLRQAFAPATVSDSALTHLTDAARLVRCAPGPFLIASPRRPEPSWWLVSRGRMALGTRTPSGQFVERRGIGPGEWLETAGAMSAPGTWLEQAECRTAVELLAIPLAALTEACTIDSAFPQAYAAVLARRIRELTDNLQDLTGADVTGRVARWLLRQTPAHDGDGAVRLRLTERKQAIARHLGTTSESLSRAFRRLTDDGLIAVRGYDVTLHDLDGLQRLAYPAV